MNTKKFETSFTIASYEADSIGEMSLFSLMNRFQELAGNHAEYLQVGYNLLKEKRTAWFLARIKVEIIKMPKWGDKVYLTTWPKGINRLFALREFCLKNEEGEILALATSAWLLVDLERNKPIKIESLEIDLSFPNSEHAINEVPDKIILPDNLFHVFNKPIWASDLDVNKHVNNAQYSKWISDSFSIDKFEKEKIKSLQINYLEETHFNDNVELLIDKLDENEKEYVIIGKSKSKNSIVFSSKVVWQNNI